MKNMKSTRFGDYSDDSPLQHRRSQAAHCQVSPSPRDPSKRAVTCWCGWWPSASPAQVMNGSLHPGGWKGKHQGTRNIFLRTAEKSLCFHELKCAIRAARTTRRNIYIYINKECCRSVIRYTHQNRTSRLQPWKLTKIAFSSRIFLDQEWKCWQPWRRGAYRNQRSKWSCCKCSEFSWSLRSMLSS